MFNHISKEEKIRQLETENQMLRSKLASTVSQMSYVAMMSDVDLPTDTTTQDGTTEVTADE
nr:MAG TPA: Transcription factor HY5 leucine zipper, TRANSCRIPTION.0A [Caudoviricetes sp.]